MSVFRRLANVAKGKAKLAGDDLRSWVDGSDSAPTAPEPSAPEEPAAPAPKGERTKEHILADAHASGLLSDEEYEAKLAALREPPAPKPKKRRL